MKKLPTIALLLILLVLGGCLEIDGQDVAVRYDADKDRIDILLIYRGLFAEGGNGSSSEPLEKAFKDIEAARETGEFVLWNNWPVQVDLTGDHQGPLSTLEEHIDVENGALFTDPQGVLCGYQFVRINRAKTFVAKVNTLLEVFVQSGFVGEGMRGISGRRKLDDDTKDFVREFLRSGEKLLVVQPGRIEVRLPFSTNDYAWLKNQIEDHFMDNMPREVLRRAGVTERRAAGGSPTDTSIQDGVVTLHGDTLKKQLEQAPTYRFFWDNDLSIQREPELTTIGLGVAGAEPLRIKKSTEGLYHDALLQKLRENKEQIEDGLPDQELTRRFENFHTRDAKLPKKLAEKRG